MAYTVINFKTKKQLKEAVAQGKEVTIWDFSGMFPCPLNGTVYLEGPHYPQPHNLYAQATLVNGIITKVK